MTPTTLLVNTTDSFADCWEPFFALLSKFWPDPKPSIVLNTEHAEFEYPGLSIRCAKVGDDPSGRRRTWSECLATCLDSIPDDRIVYMQEDYFLEAPVRTDWISRAEEELVARQAACVRLLQEPGAGPWTPTDLPWLQQVDPSARYFISLQAAVWDRRALRNALRPHETAWDFELLGSPRAARHGMRVFGLSHDTFAGPDRVMPYQPTGVMMGRWCEDIVVPLFAEHGIDVDFSQRGFHVRGWSPKNTMRRRFAKLIKMARSYR